MGPRSIGAVSGAAAAVALGVVLSPFGGAGVALLVLPAALLFGAFGALVGAIVMRLHQ